MNNDFDEALVKLGVNNSTVKQEKFTVVTAKELMERPFTELPMLVEGLIPAVGISVFAGSSDLGKSSWLRQLAIHLVTGEERYCGFKLSPKHKNVIYISSEDDDLMTRNYLGKVCSSNDNLEGIRFIFDAVNIVTVLEQTLSDAPADLVVIDCMLDYYGQNRSSSSSNEMRAFLNPFKRLASKHETQMIFLHHVGKRAEEKEPSKHNLLGSVGLEQSARLVLELRDGEEANQRFLCILKANFLASQDKRDAHELMFEDLRFRSTGQRRPAYEIVKRSTERSMEQKEGMVKKVVELTAQGLSRRAVAEQLQLPPTTVQNWLKKRSVPPNP